MALKINFDSSFNPEKPTLILATKNGNKIGQLDAKNIVVRDNMNEPSEIKFCVYKFIDGKECQIWNDITNFKLVWCAEWDVWFELTVDIDESNDIKKNIYCTRLGQAELSQCKIYNIEINTENDIARTDYKIPTTLWKPSNPEASLLHRIMEKAPHYSIIHVDDSIKNIQRTFTFDDVSIYDAFQQISEEIGCLFVFNSNSDSNGVLQRTISVYDIETNCLSCGYRGEFVDVCPKCGSKDLFNGYGKDTNIFITSDEFAENIKFSSDTDSIKNCFKLEGGDDLMTATIRNCNPNGTDYIWNITDDSKKDMSPELVNKINSYDILYNHYQNEYVSSIEESVLNKYNDLVNKYYKYNNDLSQIKIPITGYPALMTAYYNTIDLNVFLQSVLMPSIEIAPKTTASQEAKKITANNLSPVSVTDISNISLATANSAVLSIAKIIIDSRYQIKVETSSLSGQTWTGTFSLTNYSDEEDTAISSLVSITINDDYSNFVQQKIQKSLSKNDSDDLSISGLFKKDYDLFCIELQKYSMDCLTRFYDACQGCIDILIEQGIADEKTWSGSDPNLYDDLYLPYYNKLKAIESESKLRQEEINLIIGTKTIDGKIETYGIQTYIQKNKESIQNELDFQKYLGKELWLEFCSFRRESKYKNENYISDGLNNAELFDNALNFLQVAQNEIYKSSELQHSISTTLKNLLILQKFQVLVDSFAIGNWLRVQVDDIVYKLRLLSYEIDFDNLENISVEFSDVITPTNDAIKVIKNAMKVQTMATSYDAVSRQADKGKKANAQLEDWVNKSLALTNMKIVGNADNQNITWDHHGILCKEYLPLLDDYSEKQLKIINRGIYVTDDAWKTSKAGIGDFFFYNPKSGLEEKSYGVVADKLIGNLILSKEVGIYNTQNSITMDENGLTITTSSETNSNNPQTLFTIQRRTKDSDGNDFNEKFLYTDSNGDFVLNGSLKINSPSDSLIETLNDLCDSSRFDESIQSAIHEESQKIHSFVDDKYKEVSDETERLLRDYKADVNQYLRWSSDTGLELGSNSSLFKTVIDNRGMYFKENDATVAYITNNQLLIRDAVIESSLTLGNFFFAPRTDGGVSLVWKG